MCAKFPKGGGGGNPFSAIHLHGLVNLINEFVKEINARLAGHFISFLRRI